MRIVEGNKEMQIQFMRNTLKRLVWQGSWLLALALTLTACAAPPAPVAATPGPMTEAARCTAAGNTWDTDNHRIPQGYCAKGSAAPCQAAGGQWQRVCMMGTLACVQPYADANKVCRTGTDCEGRRCLQAADARGRTEPQTGRCIANNNPCYFGINLVNGQPVPTAVAD